MVGCRRVAAKTRCLGDGTLTNKYPYKPNDSTRIVYFVLIMFYKQFLTMPGEKGRELLVKQGIVASGNSTETKWTDRLER